jgi:hypothetical protein
MTDAVECLKCETEMMSLDRCTEAGCPVMFLLEHSTAHNAAKSLDTAVRALRELLDIADANFINECGSSLRIEAYEDWEEKYTAAFLRDLETPPS